MKNFDMVLFRVKQFKGVNCNFHHYYVSTVQNKLQKIKK